MSLVLVTGVNGFIGSNVALQLVKSGYRVRGTVRGGKIDSFLKSIGDKYPSLELVQLDDVGTSDLTDALKGVDAIIHVAIPLPFGGSGPEENLKTATEGTLNVLRQAVKNGISKVVVTSSWGANVDPTLKQAFEGLVTTEKDWGNVTKEEFINEEHDPMWSYLASKVLAEKAAWEFAEKEPTLDMATVAAPFIFGPYVPGFPTPDISSLSSNRTIYTLLTGIVPPPLPPLFCDVRDVARAHVAALGVPPSPYNVQDKRFLVSGSLMVWKDVVTYLHQTRPELHARLPSADADFAPFPGPPTTIDATRAKVALNMETYFDWKQMITDTVDALLDAEKSWDVPAKA